MEDSTMKRRSVKIGLIAAVALLLVAAVASNNVFMWPVFYKNSPSLDSAANREIKALLLNVMKETHSTMFAMEQTRLYTSEYLLVTKMPVEESIFVRVNSDFMDSVEKTGEDEYEAVVQLLWPNDWCYYVTIQVVEGQYLVSQVMIDP